MKKGNRRKSTPNPAPNPNTSYFIEGDDICATRKTIRRGLVTGANLYEPFMRNLECDFSPFLLPDPHPVWGILVFVDIFASNPWAQHNRGDAQAIDNRHLCYNPGEGYTILDGTLNPPGSYVWDMSTPTGYLTGTPIPFGPFGYTGGPTYSVNQWGFGDTAGPDLMPETGNWQGIRFACQVITGNGPAGNLQTFLGVNEVLPEDPNPASSRAPKLKPLPPVDKLHARAMVKKGRTEVLDRLKKAK